MGFQKCPVCNGQGTVPQADFRFTSIQVTCPTCNGHRIISELTGLPPGPSKDLTKISDTLEAKLKLPAWRKEAIKHMDDYLESLKKPNKIIHKMPKESVEKSLNELFDRLDEVKKNKAIHNDDKKLGPITMGPMMKACPKCENLRNSMFKLPLTDCGNCNGSGIIKLLNEEKVKPEIEKGTEIKECQYCTNSFNRRSNIPPTECSKCLGTGYKAIKLDKDSADNLLEKLKSAGSTIWRTDVQPTGAPGNLDIEQPNFEAFKKANRKMWKMEYEGTFENPVTTDKKEELKPVDINLAFEGTTWMARCEEHLGMVIYRTTKRLAIEAIALKLKTKGYKIGNIITKI